VIACLPSSRGGTRTRDPGIMRGVRLRGKTTARRKARHDGLDEPAVHLVNEHCVGMSELARNKFCRGARANRSHRVRVPMIPHGVSTVDRTLSHQAHHRQRLSARL